MCLCLQWVQRLVQNEIFFAYVSIVYCMLMIFYISYKSLIVFYVFGCRLESCHSLYVVHKNIWGVVCVIERLLCSCVHCLGQQDMLLQWHRLCCWLSADLHASRWHKPAKDNHLHWFWRSPETTACEGHFIAVNFCSYDELCNWILLAVVVVVCKLYVEHVWCVTMQSEWVSVLIHNM